MTHVVGDQRWVPAPVSPQDIKSECQQIITQKEEKVAASMSSTVLRSAIFHTPLLPNRISVTPVQALFSDKDD